MAKGKEVVTDTMEGSTGEDYPRWLAQHKAAMRAGKQRAQRKPVRKTPRKTNR